MLKYPNSFDRAILGRTARAAKTSTAAEIPLHRVAAEAVRPSTTVSFINYCDITHFFPFCHTGTGLGVSPDSQLFPTTPVSGWTPLGARTGLSDCAGFAPNQKTKSSLALAALSLTPCHPPGLRSVLSADPFCFCRLPPVVNNKNSRIRRNRGFQMLVTSKGKATTTKELVEGSLGVLIEALQAGKSDVLTDYLSAMARFHYYSFGNVLLIAMQKPRATRVAGMYAWNQLGRRVKRGEKGIMILAPMVGRKRKYGEEQNESDAQQADAENAENRSNGQRVGFRAVYVWDVLQTEGKDLPQFAEVTGDPAEQLPRLIEFVQAQGIKLEYSEKIAPARGLSYGGLIQLLPQMTPAEEFATLVHELAHEMIHKTERRSLISKTVKETEAESVAFVVAKAIGLEPGSASADYIQLYRGDAKLLQESLEVVQRTATAILGVITPEVAGPAGRGGNHQDVQQ